MTVPAPTDTAVQYPLGARHPVNLNNPYTPKQFPVIGQVEFAPPSGNAILRVGRTLSQTNHGWVQEHHLVLTPPERDRLIDDLLAQRHGVADPAPDAEFEPDARLVWIIDGTPTSGSVHALAEDIEAASLAGIDGPKLVYAALGERLVAVPWKVESSGYNEDDWATVTVTVDLGDGRKAEARYRADGRV